MASCHPPPNHPTDSTQSPIRIAQALCNERPKNMNWILIAYLLSLVWLSTHKERLPRGFSLKGAWNWFALIPISHFVFALLRACYFRDSGDLMLIEIWSDGFGWLFLGFSMLCLTRAIAHDQGEDAALYAMTAQQNKISQQNKDLQQLRPSLPAATSPTNPNHKLPCRATAE